jgi:hypothetical protein
MRVLIVALAFAGAVTASTQERPLPDADTFLAAARENLARADRVDHLYTFTERRTDVHTNPFGRLGTDGISVYQVYPSAIRQLTYRRLIEREGERVSAPALARADREYVTRAQQILAERGGADQAARQVAEQRARSRGQTRIEDIVNTLEFKVAGRETYQSVPTVVVTFSGRPAARPQTREGRIAQKFQGKVWIHEALAEVMRVEAEAVESISFGFGIIARLNKGTTASLTRRPVEGGVWMPTEIRLSGRGRAALVRSLVLDFVLQWSDYRRLPGTSLTPFLDAGIQGQSSGSPE